MKININSYLSFFKKPIMKKKLLTLLFFLLILNANAQEIWQKVSPTETSVLGKKERVSIPKTEHYFKLDLAAFKQALQNGAWSVCVGTAITNPYLLTKQFVGENS